MKFDKYLQTWKGSLSENKFNRYVLLTMAVTNLVLGMFVLSKNQTVVMVPPNLSVEAKVADDSADAGYKEEWATHIAMMLGNVTPRSAPYISDQIGKLMGPQVYRKMMDGINSQAKKITEEQLTIQFVPNQAFYLPEKDVVVVSGEYTIRGMQDAEEKMIRTYEIGVDIHKHLVRVDSFEVYEGAWSAQREEMKKVEEKKQRKEALDKKRSS